MEKDCAVVKISFHFPLEEGVSRLFTFSECEDLGRIALWLNGTTPVVVNPQWYIFFVATPLAQALEINMSENYYLVQVSLTWILVGLPISF